MAFLLVHVCGYVQTVTIKVARRTALFRWVTALTVANENLVLWSERLHVLSVHRLCMQKFAAHCSNDLRHQRVELPRVSPWGMQRHLGGAAALAPRRPHACLCLNSGQSLPNITTVFADEHLKVVGNGKFSCWWANRQGLSFYYYMYLSWLRTRPPWKWWRTVTTARYKESCPSHLARKPRDKLF